eukprot:jgi/Ulvmu1/1031/UM104_0016.1
MAGPFVRSPSGSHYYLVIVDDFSGYKIVLPLANKSDAADVLLKAIPHLEKKYKADVGAVRYDRDTVCLTQKVQKYLEERGFDSQPTSGYSPQEKGHAERAIGTLSDLRGAVLADAGLNRMYWVEAVRHAAYLSNIMSSDGSASPWELMKGKKPDISNLHVLGCTCHMRMPTEKRKKGQLPANATAGKFLGTGRACLLNKSLYGLKQAPRVWNKTLSAHIVFLGIVQNKRSGALLMLFSEQLGFMLILCYIDDVQIAAKKLSSVQSVKKAILSKFPGKDLGQSKYFLQI